MIRLFYLLLLMFLPLFADGAVMSEKHNSETIALSSDNTMQKSQNITVDTFAIDSQSSHNLQSKVSVSLILIGLAFMIAEVLVPGFGILGIGGVIAFASGSLLLFDTDTIGRSSSIPLIVAVTITNLVFFLLMMKLFVKSRAIKATTRVDNMVGSDAEVVDIRARGYLVDFNGEIWTASSKSELTIGQRVKIVELFGLVLKVKPIKE